MTVQSLLYEPGDDSTNIAPSLQVLDQLVLPHETKYIEIRSLKDTFSVIRTMQIRGAPLIAIVAVLGLSIDLFYCQEELKQIETVNAAGNTKGALLTYIQGKIQYLKTSRPTAVNLFNLLQELDQVLQSTNGEAQKLYQTVKSFAEFALARDTNDCRLLGEQGADELLRDDRPLRLLTICNTGVLACTAYGTALGVVRAIHQRGKLQHITALETRPYNQGSRLTAYELVQEQMPATLICDSAAAAMMQSKQIDAVLVGADRICANGDTANKIGTYQLALVAAAHNVPFYVVAPTTTLDTSIQSGDDIPIEERSAEEVIESSNAPKNIAVWNPAFDVTPAKYITGIITEKGVIRRQANGIMDVPGFLLASSSSSTTLSTTATSTTTLAAPHGYLEQSVDSLPIYLAQNAPQVMQKLGTTSASDLECVEVGDGNLNLVFIVTNCKTRQNQVIVKQALPYVRCVGESWPLTLERSYFEYRALTLEQEACPEHTPSVYYFSRPHGLMVMEYLAPPFLILRKGLIQGIRYSTMATDLARFCAKTLFRTSGLALSETQMRENVANWSNFELCALTEQVIFTEPYMQANNNRWTLGLESDKLAIERDVDLKVAAAQWKHKFVTGCEALIHGDLHTGSVLCKEGATYVIDPEFAYYGPMGFDTGALVGNWLLAYVSQAGHDNADYDEWILEQICVFWKALVNEFKVLWKNEHTGYLFATYLEGEEGQSAFFDTLLHDTLGFAGMKMLRRIVGIAHVEDLESITDESVRVLCERHGLEVAKVLIKSASTFGSMEQVIELARSKKP